MAKIVDSDVPWIVRSAEARRMPWRNGGGETVEVAVHPPGAALDAFGWRVSLATITGDGPFSTFHGVDRTFAVVKGGVVLTVGSGRPTRLDVSGEPLRFPGEAPCSCSLSDGTTTALNVMTARGTFDCAIARLDHVHRLPTADDAVTVLICVDGEIATDVGPLGPLDALVMPIGAAVGVRSGSAPARAVTVSVRAVSRPRPKDGRRISPP